MSSVYRPSFKITSHLLNLLEEISTYREKIQNSLVKVPWIPKLRRESRIRNTQASTAIEGNPLNIDEVAILEETGALPYADEHAQQEVKNYLKALQYIEKKSRLKGFKKVQLLKLHRLIGDKVMQQGKAGVYRQMAVRVGSYLPPAAKKVPQMIEELIAWANQDGLKWSPVISSSVIHYRFEEIHPFADGNGRVGRAWALWELYRRGFDTNHIFSVDEIFWEFRPRYYQALSLVQKQHGDLSSWLEFCAECIHLALERTHKRIEQLHVAAKAGPELVLSTKQEKLLHLLANKTKLKPKEIWQILRVTRQGAALILKPLLQHDLIERVGTPKSGYYRLKK